MICPLHGACKAKVDFEHYREYCINVGEDKYKECPHYQKVASEKRTPAEWAELTRPR